VEHSQHNSDARAFVDPGKLLTTGEAADLTEEYSQRGLQAAIRRGDLRAVRIGRWDYIHEDDLYKFLADMKKKGQAKFDPWASGKRLK
jgi:hypothetical protein